MQGLDHETFLFVCVSPSCLFGSFVIKHVCHWDESICLRSFYVHTKDSRRNHHSNLRETLEFELFIFWDFVTNRLEVCSNVLNFLLNLLEKRRTFKFFLLFVIEEYWEVLKSLGKNVDEREEVGISSLFFFLKNKCGEERVFGRK